MVFFKNLFILLFLSVSLFAQESIITSQEIISTDSPEELIDNRLETTVESIDTNIPTKEVTSITKEETSSSQPKEHITPILDKAKGVLKKSFREAIAQAKEEHKLILLEVYGTNCHFCEKMESEVFPLESVIKELEDNFILVKINGDEEKIPLGITMQMTPMHVFITETEDIKDMTFGFLGEKDFLELLDREKN